MTDLDLDNAAWRFALDLYRCSGVAPECLKLQDEAGVDVSLLLVCLWLGRDRGVALDEAAFIEIEAVANAWATVAVAPLRTARRGVKLSPEIERPAVQAFRAHVQKAEIEAERIEIALLFDWAEGRARAGWHGAGCTETARRNLAVVLGTKGLDAGRAPTLWAALAETQDAAGDTR